MLTLSVIYEHQSLKVFYSHKAFVPVQKCITELCKSTVYCAMYFSGKKVANTCSSSKHHLIVIGPGKMDKNGPNIWSELELK